MYTRVRVLLVYDSAGYVYPCTRVTCVRECGVCIPVYACYLCNRVRVYVYPCTRVTCVRECECMYTRVRVLDRKSVV